MYATLRVTCRPNIKTIEHLGINEDNYVDLKSALDEGATVLFGLAHVPKVYLLNSGSKWNELVDYNKAFTSSKFDFESDQHQSQKI